MKRTALLLLSAVLLAAGTFHIENRIPVGGIGGWDYLLIDNAANRLYLSHDTKVEVIDLKTSKVIGEIADTPGVHGIAIASKHNRGYTTNGRSNNVSIFDLKTLKATGQIPVGQNPDAVLYDASSDRVFVFNGRSKDASVIDAAKNEVISTIPLGGKPEFSQADGKGQVYVNIEDTHEVAVIDAAKLTVLRKYTLEGCDEPTGLAFDAKHRRLFSACHNKVMSISDPDKGKVIASVPIGGATDGAAFDPGTGLAFSSNGEGSVTVIAEKAGAYSVLETITTQRGSKTMTLDPKSHKLYVPAAEYGPMPAATKDVPRPRAPVLPGSFTVLVIGR